MLSRLTALIVPTALLLACAADPAETAPPVAGAAVPPPGVDPAERLPGYEDGCAALEGGLVVRMSPDVPVDYLSFRWEERTSAGETRDVKQEAGVLCGKASDIDGCRAKVDAHRELPETCAGVCNTGYFLATRGDDVVVAGFYDGIYALMGRIDVPAEAFMTATFRKQYQAACQAGHVAPLWTRAGDGFDLVMEKYECTEVEGEKLTFRVRVHVSEAGAVTELGKELVARKTGGPECTPMPAAAAAP